MDIHNVFLQGDLDKKIFMISPQGLLNLDDKWVCKLKRSLYGLKQTSRNWFSKLRSKLLEMGFKQSTVNYSLFTHTKGDKVAHLLVYLDDIIIIGSDSQVIIKLKKQLKTYFYIKRFRKTQVLPRSGIDISVTRYPCQPKKMHT